MTRFCPAELPPKFKSLAMLERFHSQFVEALPEKEDLERTIRLTFPSPPVVSDDEDVIVGIRTPAQLVAVALRFANCLSAAEWARSVANGDRFFYMTTGKWGPEKTVFSLTREFGPPGGPPEIWILEWVERPHGRPLRNPRTRLAITSWLRRAQNLGESVCVCSMPTTSVVPEEP
jgi:hypothetical protein